MENFLVGVISSLSATLVLAIIVKWGWPTFQDQCLYQGVRVDGEWDILEAQNDQIIKVGRIVLRQTGRNILGRSARSLTRDGKASGRKFLYKGTISGNQVTLIFEDSNGVGFDTGTYVFTVFNDQKNMLGVSTFYGKKENKIVSESRRLKKVFS